MTDTDYATAQKLNRASTHLKELHRTVNRFLGSKANGVENDFTSEEGYLIVRAFSRRKVPGSCPGLIGDFLYNERAALDYWACELVRVNGGEVGEKTNFPIFIEQAKFRDPGNKQLRRVIKEKVGQAHWKHLEVIEEEQPFQGVHGVPEDDPLWLLYLLSNHDRHQFAALTSVVTNAGSQKFTPRQAGERFQLVSATDGEVEREREVARYRIVDGPAMSAHVHSDLIFDIAFGPGGPCAGRPVVSTLAGIAVRAGELIERLMKVDTSE